MLSISYKSPKLPRIVENSEEPSIELWNTMLILGYNISTVDAFKWSDTYASQTAILSKAFYSAFKSLKINTRIVILEYVKICPTSWSCQQTFSKTREFVDDVQCEHETKCVNIIFRYNKYSKYLLSADFASDRKLYFKNGILTDIKYNGCIKSTVMYITRGVLMPSITPEGISVEYKHVMVPSEYILRLSMMSYAGYGITNLESVYVKSDTNTFTLGENMICYNSYGFSNKPPKGISKIFSVNSINDYGLSYCADSYGVNFIADIYSIEFTAHGSHHDDCDNVFYGLEGYEEPGKAKKTYIWDFSNPIPMRFVHNIQDIAPCCERYIDRN